MNYFSKFLVISLLFCLPTNVMLAEENSENINDPKNEENSDVTKCPIAREVVKEYLLQNAFKYSSPVQVYIGRYTNAGIVYYDLKYIPIMDLKFLSQEEEKSLPGLISVAVDKMNTDLHLLAKWWQWFEIQAKSCIQCYWYYHQGDSDFNIRKYLNCELVMTEQEEKQLIEQIHHEDNK